MSVSEMLVKYRDARKSLDAKFENKEISMDIYSYLVLFMNKVIDDLMSITEKSSVNIPNYTPYGQPSYGAPKSTANREIEAMDESTIGYWTSGGITKI